MRVAKIYFILLVTFIIIGCGVGHDTSQLVEVDSLLTNRQYQEAYDKIQKVDKNELDDQNIAYYDLLMTMAKERMRMPITSTDGIDESQRYYENKRGQERKYAYACLYKGIIFFKQKNYDKASICLKQAEKACKDVKDDEAHFMVMSYLSLLNKATNNLKLGDEYCHKLLGYALDKKNSYWIGYAYQNLGTSKAIQGDRDSSIVYTLKSTEYIDLMPERDKHLYIMNIGAAYSQLEDYDKAESYFKKALKVNPSDEVYFALVSLYSYQEKDKEAAPLWKYVLNMKDERLRITCIKYYIEWLTRQGRYEEATQYGKKLVALKDSVSKAQNAEEIRMKQERFDREITEQEHRIYTIKLWSGIVLALMAVVFLCLEYKRRMIKVKEEISNNQQKIEEYTKQIEALAVEGKEYSRETNELQRKVKELRDRQGEILAAGKQRYEEIDAGGSTAQWRKVDFAQYVEYYRMLDPDFVLQIEQDYSALPPAKITLLILQHKGFTDKSIAHALCMTDGALRTARSRVRSRKKE